MSSWSFAQLGQFIAYKGRRAGVPVVHVDPAASPPVMPVVQARRFGAG
jgi:transposase